MAESTETRRGAPLPLEVPYPSKVTLPARRPAIVHRERLIQSLSEALRHRVTLISAPAGYGKTTLLLDFAQYWDDRVCWYALDERDRDLHTFLRYFLAAGQQQFPDFGPELAQALRDGDPISAENALDLMAMATQATSQEFVVILDDFHHLDDAAPELRQAIDGWLCRLPPNCHAILAGRTQPQLSVLPLMSARQEVESITMEDFSFKCEEVVQLFRDVLGKEISLDDAQHLADVTEGWAAALVLMADKVQASRTSISLEQLRGSDTLFQYIAREQFDPLPPDVKEFLAGSAVLRTIEEELVNELLAITDTEDKLNYLERQNLFVLRDKDDKSRHRYHRLFRAFLVSFLRSRDQPRFKELNLKASALREQAEEWEEAVYHCIQAGDWERIVQITERVGWRLFEEGKWDTLADWLDAVPSEELAGLPNPIIWKARILHHLNQVDRALALLAQAIVSFEAKQDWVALAEALVIKGIALRVKGDYRDSKEALSKARSLLLQHDGPTSALAEARKELGITLSRGGELSQAVQELKSVLEIYEAQGDTYNIAHTSDQIGVTLGLAGSLAESAGYLERARQRWMKLGNNHRLVETLINLGVTYYLQGDYQNSENVVRLGLEKARLISSPRPEVYLLATLGDIKRDTGEYANALELYNACLDQAWSLDDAYITTYTADSIANTYRLMGEIGSGESWADRAMVEAEKRGGSLERGLCLVTAGLMKRSHGELKEAIEHLETAVPLLKEVDAKRELCTAYFHLAGAYFALKRKRLALEFLDLAARVVSALGYDHFLLVEAKRNPLLVQYASANKLSDGYFGHMLKTMKSSAPATSQEANDEATTDSGATTVYAYGLGQPRAVVGGREISDLEWRSEKSKEMFFFFLCNRRPLRKEEIVTALWPDLAEEKTTSLFHSNLYRLRQALYPECIAKEIGRYILDPQGSFWFDGDEFQEALKQADGLPPESDEAVAAMEKALACYTGAFGQEIYTEWVETLRWQAEEQYMRLLATLAPAYTQRAEYTRSAGLCQQILSADEDSEATWYRLMSNYILADQMEAAAFCYRKYVDIVAEGVGAEDIPEFDDICREVKGKVHR